MSCRPGIGNRFGRLGVSRVEVEAAVYAVANSNVLRLTNRLTKAQVTNKRCAFFFNPR